MPSRDYPPSRWITRSKVTTDSQVRLFCFPYAGASGSLFQDWSININPAIEVCPIQLPGREARFREKAVSDLGTLVQELANHLQPFMDIPFALFGHSVGAIIAYELSRHCVACRLPVPLHLFASGHRAPQLPHSSHPISHLPRQDFVEEIRKLGGTPDDVIKNDELLELWLPVIRADMTIWENYTYRHGTELSCGISVFGGDRDSRVPLHQLPLWKEQTRGRFRLRVLNGDHFFVKDDSCRRAILAAISDDLQNDDNQ